MGALSNLWVGDWLGRRKTIVLGGVIMIIGAILQTASVSYAMLVAARVITGLGNGLNVCTVCLNPPLLFFSSSLPFGITLFAFDCQLTACLCRRLPCLRIMRSVRRLIRGGVIL